MASEEAAPKKKRTRKKTTEKSSAAKSAPKKAPLVEAEVADAPVAPDGQGVPVAADAPAAQSAQLAQPMPRPIGKLQIQQNGILYVVNLQADVTPFESAKISLLMMNVIIAPTVLWDIDGYIHEFGLTRHFELRPVPIQGAPAA